MVRAKDREIDDYKAVGALGSRNETAPFDEDKWEAEMHASALFSADSITPWTMSANNILASTLYGEVGLVDCAYIRL